MSCRRHPQACSSAEPAGHVFSIRCPMFAILTPEAATPVAITPRGERLAEYPPLCEGDGVVGTPCPTDAAQRHTFG
jgi:hypothetical protein